MLVPKPKIDSSDSENTLAAAIIFVLGAVGICVNSCAILVVIQRRLQKNPFGILCLAHICPDVIILTTFTVFCAPVTFLQVKSIQITEISKILGHVDLIAWNVTVYSHVFIAINRFTAIYFPIIYRNFFKVKTTMVIVFCYATLACVQTTPLFFEGCFLFYIPSFYLWSFSQTRCGSIIQTADMSLGITLMTTVMIVNFCTFYKIKRTIKSFNSSQTSVRSQQVQDIKFFMQALVQATVYIAKKLSFYVFSRFATDKWTLFFLTFFAWIMCHLLDGVILIAYNYNKQSRRVVADTTTKF